MLNTKVLLKNLENHFKEYEEQFELLRWIDEAVGDDESSLERFFYERYSRFKKTFNAKRIGMFSFSNNSLFSFKFDNVQISGNTLFTPENLPEIPNEVKEGKVIITHNWQDSYITLFIPLIFFENVLFLVILQDDSSALESTRLNKDVVSFVEDIAKRINVVIQYKENIRTGKVKDNLIGAFFENKLNPNQCWGKIKEVHKVIFVFQLI